MVTQGDGYLTNNQTLLRPTAANYFDVMSLLALTSWPLLTIFMNKPKCRYALFWPSAYSKSILAACSLCSSKRHGVSDHPIL